MKRKLIIFLLVWICFILQTTVFSTLTFFTAAPNVLIILTVSIGFMQGRTEGLLTGFLCGLLVDLFYGKIFGFFALVYLLVGYFCGRYSKIYFDEDVKIPLLLTGAGELFLNLMIYIGQFMLRGRTDFGGYLKGVILPETVSTLLAAIILYRLFYKLNHSLVEKEKKGRQSLWIRN
ncbi:MAG: rod shape-determining protein MreD [Lachnospiraceae bacterium]|nr:rod shape-determining protein MreD [Lachnospiraceae bacterium]